MFFQLGTRQYNGLKSFLSFGEESEAVVVEYALIGRKPRLQGTANSLTTINISFLFHKNYCDVKQEIDALKTSKSNYEILPLLAGSGELYGDYVITSLSIERSQMDDYGNTTAADVTISLKENIREDKQQQLQQNAAQNATATGNKKPVTKSKRQNPPTCNLKVSRLNQTIQSNYAQVNGWISKITAGANASPCLANLKAIDSAAQSLNKQVPTLPCVQTPAGLQTCCTQISQYAQQLEYVIIFDKPLMSGANNNLGTAVSSLNTLTHYNQVQVGAGK